VARSGAAVPDADTELSEASPEPEPAEADAELPDAEGQLSEAGDPASTVWVVRGVSRYHLHECVLIQVVDDEDVDTMTLAEAAATGCTPCRACHSD